MSDYSNSATKLQSEKAHSLDNLYNFDDSINSENNVQKRKYANLNLKSKTILKSLEKFFKKFLHQKLT